MFKIPGSYSQICPSVCLGQHRSPDKCVQDADGTSEPFLTFEGPTKRSATADLWQLSLSLWPVHYVQSLAIVLIRNLVYS